MSTTATRARQIELEAAQRRVIERLKTPPRRPSQARRAAIVALAAVLFVIAFSARLAVDDPNALLANFYIVPIAVLAIEFGTRAGLLAAALAFALVPAWSVINAVHVDALGYVSRGAAFLVTGVIARTSASVRTRSAIWRCMPISSRAQIETWRGASLGSKRSPRSPGRLAARPTSSASCR